MSISNLFNENGFTIKTSSNDHYYSPANPKDWKKQPECVADALDELSSRDGSGTVKSIDITASKEFVVKGSPVTSIGSVSIEFDSVGANKFLAGPVSGNAQPSFRTITSGDLPYVIQSNTTGTAGNITGICSVRCGGTGCSDSASAWSALSKCQNAGEIPYMSGLGVVGALAPGPEGSVLSIVNGVPTWVLK